MSGSDKSVDGISKDIQIILASASDKRKKLLLQAGYDFKVSAPDIDESSYYKAGICPADYASRLAAAKAFKVSVDYPDSIVIGADTVVDCNGRVIGKAVNEKHAEQILTELFNTPHCVITALAIICRSRNIEIIDSESTRIYPRPMSHIKRAGYLKSGKWRGKAGAYAIRPRGDENIEKIEGSVTNVMGLPLELLQKQMAQIKIVLA